MSAPPQEFSVRLTAAVRSSDLASAPATSGWIRRTLSGCMPRRSRARRRAAFLRRPTAAPRGRRWSTQPGTAAGGLFASTNGGTTWTPLTSGLPSTFNYAKLAISPQSHAIYAALSDRSDAALAGLFRSLDGGQSWTALGRSATTPVCRAAATPLELTCSQCWFSLLMAVNPTDAGKLFFGERFLYRSTDDGNSWLDVRLGDDPCTFKSYVFGDNHAVVFDARGRMLVANDGGLQRSRDNGTTWESLNTNLSLRQFYPGISIHPTDPSV